MNYGKITKQELSQELIDIIENSSDKSVIFMKEGEEIPIEERKDGVLYILEVSDPNDE